MDPHSPPVVAGRYALLQPIGAGATSRVFRAHDRLLDRTVALKLLRPCDDELAAARLRDEAVIAASLHHPGIARVYDHGETEVDGELRPYLTMELVKGMTLREALQAGPLAPGRVRHLVAQVASALAHAHDSGVVHRDVKPGNIMLTPDGRAVLLDFGIARRAGIEPLTLTGMIVGTVDYLSSEQANGQSATPRSDLYSLGCVAYEALTGRRPFKRDTVAETLAAHANCEAEPLPSDVPPGLRALVEQLVRRDPAERPADAATVAELALRPTDEEAPISAAARAGRPRRRRPRIRVSTAAAAAVAAVATVLLTGQIEPEGSLAAAAGASSPAAQPPTPSAATAIVRVQHHQRPAAHHKHAPAHHRARPALARPAPAAPSTPASLTTPTPAHPPKATPHGHAKPTGPQEAVIPTQLDGNGRPHGNHS